MLPWRHGNGMEPVLPGQEEKRNSNSAGAFGALAEGSGGIGPDQAGPGRARPLVQQVGRSS